MSSNDDVAHALDAACRSDYGRIVSLLTRVLGSLEAAEDVLQGAFATALEQWRRRGVPSNPAAWLTTVSRRAAIDVVRRRRAGSRAVSALAAAAERSGGGSKHAANEADPAGSPDTAYELLARWPDERLKLIFMCCHPRLPVAARIALTLKEVCGLSTPSVAATFLVSEQAMAQRLVRAKRSLRQNGAVFEVPQPDEFGERVEDVLKVIYLLFNHGYLPSEGSEILRSEVCGEAVYLARLVCTLLDQHGAQRRERAEALGLASLLTLLHSRRYARVDAEGVPVVLEEQDRSLWVNTEVRDGLSALDRAIALSRPGPYQIKAAVNALHHTATDAADTDWSQIHALYTELETYEPTPIVRLNAAVALGMSAGPAAGLQALDSLAEHAGPTLRTYPYYYLAVARFLEECGRGEEAKEALWNARETSKNRTERLFIERRLSRIAKAR